MFRVLAVASSLAVAACSAVQNQPSAQDGGASPNVAVNGPAQGEASGPSTPSSSEGAVAPATGGRLDPALAGETTPGLQPPRVEPIRYAEFTDRIPSGYGCSFTSADDQLLFVSTVEPNRQGRSSGAIKIAGEVEVVSTDVGGDHNRLARGATFANAQGWGVFVRRLSDRSRPAGESVISWPATMVVSMEGGGSITFPDGRWSCGS